MNITLTPEQQFAIFGTTETEQQLAEAEEHWGTRPSWQEPAHRSAACSYEDWAAIKTEGDEIVCRFAGALRSATPATDEAAMEVAEEHRRHQSKWFFDCDSTVRGKIAAA